MEEWDRSIEREINREKEKRIKTRDRKWERERNRKTEYNGDFKHMSLTNFRKSLNRGKICLSNIIQVINRALYIIGVLFELKLLYSIQL